MINMCATYEIYDWEVKEYFSPIFIYKLSSLSSMNEYILMVWCTNKTIHKLICNKEYVGERWIQ
jgi:hypothetical protein